jgi:hypothetical protein
MFPSFIFGRRDGCSTTGMARLLRRVKFDNHVIDKGTAEDCSSVDHVNSDAQEAEAAPIRRLYQSHDTNTARHNLAAVKSHSSLTRM